MWMVPSFARNRVAWFPAVILLWWGLAAALAAQTTDNELPRKPSPMHYPQIATPAPGDPAEYRAQLIDLTERYGQLYYSADLRGAVGEARRGLDLAEESGNLADQAQFLKALGYVSWLLGETAVAIDYEQRLLAIADQLDDDRLRSHAHRVMGTVYRQIGDGEKGREHTQTALERAERAGDLVLRNAALNNLAVIALDAGDTVSARRFHTVLLHYREERGEAWDIAGSLTNLADVAIAEGDFQQALELHERALGIRQEIGDQRGIVRSLSQVAGMLRLLGRTDEALARLEDALVRARAITGHELLGDVWQEITLTHEARGEFAEALAAEREAGKAREALAGERTLLRIADLQARYDDTRKEATIERLEQERHLQEAEIARVRQRNLLLVSMLAGGALLLGIIIWLQRARLRAERVARDTAEQANALKSRLVGILSHDIRGPLGGTLFLAEELLAEASPHSTDDRLHLMVNELSHLQDLAQDLLDAAAIEGGGLRLSFADTDLVSIAQEVVQRYRTRAEIKQQQIIVAPALPDAGRLVGDADKLQQVAANILSNAIKYSPAAATIEISIERQGTGVRFTISDEGPGFSEEDRRKLFQPFTRLSAQPTGGESSHGFGLSIVQEIVRAHHGSVEITPRTSVQGSHVSVLLPVGH
jgi:signal transduction histidine kinase